MQTRAKRKKTVELEKDLRRVLVAALSMWLCVSEINLFSTLNYNNNNAHCFPSCNRNISLFPLSHVSRAFALAERASDFVLVSVLQSVPRLCRRERDPSLTPTV